jgi:hypothetical protein
MRDDRVGVSDIDEVQGGAGRGGIERGSGGCRNTIKVREAGVVG